MPREVVEPVEAEGHHGGKSYDHPAFGQITLNRVSGSRTLYGSDFEHRAFVRITILRSQLQRDLSRDWYFRRGEIVAVDLSEAQWATFVSSFNVGDGVPCTIAAVDGKYVPEFPLRDEGQLYKAEADARLADSIAQLKDLEKKLQEGTSGLSKVKAGALVEHVWKAIQQLQSNLPFVAKSFGEHMEERVEKAKVEVHAYVNNVVRQAGLETIAAKPPLQIGKVDDGDE